MPRLFILVCAAALAACDNTEPVVAAGTEVRFVPLNQQGAPSSEVSQQACVLDKRTGLTWERKTTDQGLHDWRHTYSWFDPDTPRTGRNYSGVHNRGTCSETSCDTWGLAHRVNATRLCGFKDWRVPTRAEMYSLVEFHIGIEPPIIDTEFFPLTQSSDYWTANDEEYLPTSAWTWDYEYSRESTDSKRKPHYVRLVRGVAPDLAQAVQ